MAPRDDDITLENIETVSQDRPASNAVEQGNAVVLFDIGLVKSEFGHQNLKLAKDGHVRTQTNFLV
jgi:hypothetical protein